VFSHEHVRSLLLGALASKFPDTERGEDYRLVGFGRVFCARIVKQFRDIIVPILCVACHPVRWDVRPPGFAICRAADRARGRSFPVNGWSLFNTSFAWAQPFLIDRYTQRPAPRIVRGGAGLLLVLFGHRAAS